MPAGLRIHLYCLCWNDARMLPYFFRHYDEYVDEYFVYDNGSTDGSLQMLRDHGRVQIETFEVQGDSFVEEERRLGDKIWQRSRGKADWVIVTDIDEHLYRPDLLGYLERCRAQGITAIKSIGFEMVADDFPTAEDKLINLVTRGCRSDGHDRLCIFNPDALTATHYGPGRHKAWPEGYVVWPPSSEVLLLHYKQLGVKYVGARSAQLAQGIKPGDLERGWGQHYQWSAKAIVEHWAKMKAEALPVPGLGELAHVAPADYRGDEKIVEESGLLEDDWYLTEYEDVADIQAEALTHFCRYGWREGRKPNFYFDPVWYEANYPHSASDGNNPLIHYILRGEREGDWPSHHFDTGWYREKHSLEPDESPLRHYLLRRTSGTVSPLPDFNVERYCENYPEVLASGRDPYEDFLQRRATPVTAEAPYPSFATVVAKLGFDPDAGVYPANVPWHSFLEVLRLFLPRYPLDEAWYRVEYPDVDAAVHRGDVGSALTHFVEHGFFEGRGFRAPEETPAPSVDEKPMEAPGKRPGDPAMATPATAAAAAAMQAGALGNGHV